MKSIILVENFESNPIENAFRPIAVILHIVGLEVITVPKGSTWKNFIIRFVMKIPKCMAIVIYTLRIVYAIFKLILVSDIKFEVLTTTFIVLEIVSYASLYQSRDRFHAINQQLGRLCKSRKHAKSARKIQSFLNKYVFLNTILMLGTSFFYYLFQEDVFDEKSHSLNIHTKRVLKILSINDPLFIMSFGCLYFSFTMYYCFVCEILSRISKDFIPKLWDQNVERTYKELMANHYETTLTMKSLDKAFSKPLLFTVMFCMYLLFWSSYRFVFHVSSGYGSLIHYILTISYSLSLLIPLVAFASKATESAEEARIELRSLPSVLPHRFREIEIQLRGACKLEIRLTLWSMFDITRSLVVSILGTILTYGILIGTLGNTQN